MTGLENLQTKIGVKADGAFGPATLKAAMAYFKMTPDRAAHFFGQCGTESGSFHVFIENLNYTAEQLVKVFPHYFPTIELANAYAHQPNKIASKVYGSRMGNGDEASGDGYTFRGRGAIQLTGKQNYQLFSNYIKNPEIMKNPDLVATDYAFESALYFFTNNGLFGIADKGVTPETILAVTKRVNGGTNGLDTRTSLTNTYHTWLTT